jgi:CRP/FNR family cyclic AMP-dependent transcriptional regulator
MSPIPYSTVFQRTLATLPLETYERDETVIAAGSKTGRLLILRKGAVAIVKDHTEIARVAEPGAVFGELSVLLDQPHTADVCALENSQFHVADAATFSNEIRSRFFTLRRCWHSGLTVPIALSFN